MIYESYLGGVLIHHGVKGMRWGVRRTPEQLGHVTNSAVANAEEAVKIVDGVYQSSKRVHSQAEQVHRMVPEGRN